MHYLDGRKIAKLLPSSRDAFASIAPPLLFPTPFLVSFCGPYGSTGLRPAVILLLAEIAKLRLGIGANDRKLA